ncbi:hypothetical protein AUEXF2481DRAFT_1279 [Aureobasidium subglaciale EXF-2481]|uniref:Uncharacterized protein n=1 Tax=Aureobasidium subglaciale (strain EXF-2481) TaxID=1043005 RepID=A0A074Z093_AURSE|nr:uncharacterized protein AUEXF2481DRAFT_1279 [Aureobasidium subglaciale EXF-2481]KAI5211386.1 hypothetical protein E4T38_01510 [Aureobasidium subglaciale]KAI5229670.1 hypothetical protein E4T40_01511 [Aureobasidium subglaciale]KAI5233323.1 hypothetical protein E4T41_01508 [Aureobasidium subglaciale]KAI5266550.1 hypothetical protein E4T46_01510 [Aureobasidium subglaciale]KEQ99797.1 hypothetical protein AUEXF2481DRAFT_1279 [Aureobasidium subglaciale EXF-2481]
MANTNEGPVFRASKRRKVFRKRRDDDEASDGDAVTRNGPATVADGRQEQELGLDTKEVSVAARHVRPTGSRKGGVGFSSTRAGNESGTSSVFDTNAPPTPLNAVEHAQARFVAPTGHIASADDKHMMAYVDSKLARLTPSHEASTSSTSTHPTSTPAEPASASTAVTPAHNTVSSIPASHGHLDEVNIPKPSHPSTTTTIRSQKRPRKPWHSRRTSADIARDALVDQILQESALHTYSSTPAPPPPAQEEGDADERMAEEFKRNFYAAAEERASRRGGHAAPLPPTFGANKLESIKGPKLGGSRSQRAAMHAAEKAKAAKK